VLGGTSLAGGVGSVVATAIGALFLTQLEQVMLGMGAPASIQLVIQGSIIAIGTAIRGVRLREAVRGLTARGRRASPSLAGADDPAPDELVSSHARRGPDA
jgi:ribose transport system permease protein